MKLGASARIFPWNQCPLLWELCANFLFAFSHLWSVSHPERATAHFKYLFSLHLKLFQYGDDLKWCLENADLDQENSMDGWMCSFCCWGEYLSSFYCVMKEKQWQSFPSLSHTLSFVNSWCSLIYRTNHSRCLSNMNKSQSSCYCEDVYHCWLFVRMCLKKVNFCSSWTAAVHLADAAHLKQMMLILSRQRLFISAQPLR